MFKALARGFRWRKLLETGVYGSIEEIARAEKINSSYVGRLLQMTLLAPATVEAILGGRASAGPTLAEAIGVFPVEWSNQSRKDSDVTSQNNTCLRHYPESFGLWDGSSDLLGSSSSSRGPAMPWPTGDATDEQCR
jgi:hypothetical protein